MPITGTQVLQAAKHWSLTETTNPIAERLANYGNLLLQWNARISLTSIRDEAELIERHLLEGVFAAANHPQAATSLDFGSGTGIPGIPIALCLPALQVTLAESQRKKATFLHEAIRQLGLRVSVHADRAETLAPGSFDAVWMRAVDKSATMLPIAASLVAPGGSLCLLGTATAPAVPTPEKWEWKSRPLPGSNSRVLHIGTRI